MIVLIITIFKLNRNIRETEKKIEYFDEDRTEKEIYKNSYVELRDEFINFRAKMEEEKLKFSSWSRIFSASAAASKKVEAGKTTINSSPPTRQQTSCSLKLSFISPASTFNTLSP